MKGFARWHGGFFRLWLLLSVFFVSFVRGLYEGFRTEGTEGFLGFGRFSLCPL